MINIKVSQIINNEYRSVMDKLRVLGSEEKPIVINDMGAEYEWLNGYEADCQDWGDLRITLNGKVNWGTTNILPKTVGIISTIFCDRANVSIRAYGDCNDTLRVSLGRFGDGLSLYTNRNVYFHYTSHKKVEVINVGKDVIFVQSNSAGIRGRVFDENKSYLVNNIKDADVKKEITEIVKDLTQKEFIWSLEKWIKTCKKLIIRLSSYFGEQGLMHSISVCANQLQSNSFMKILNYDIDKLNRLYDMVCVVEDSNSNE